MIQTRKCERCGKRYAIGDWPLCPHGLAYGKPAQGFNPVVIFKNASGQIQFPGRSNDPLPKGYERVELRTMREVQKFERDYGSRLRSEKQRQSEREAERIEPMISGMRSRLRQMMRGELPVPIHNETGAVVAMEQMSARGRDLAQLAIDYNNQRSSRERSPDFLIEPFHYDRGSRSPHRSEDTDWKPRY